ncbi:MAG: 2Fe-2S iron-sulfur cluster binding domain-containing protein [Nanoarchaeota archaeon]|nr:2Fe-2S iron-sulfur cluster binding domain-containing protein [Nanoarchaeota archaeon]
MAFVMRENQKVEVPDGSPIREACEELGIPFGCRSGLCRTCEIAVLEGMSNLAEKNDLEKDHDLPPHHRLACQAQLLKGTVKVESGW